MTSSSPTSPAGSAPGDDAAPAWLRRVVSRIAAGQEAALRELYDAAAPAMLGIAKRILGEDPLAEQAVTEAFLQIWNDAASYDARRASVRGWTVMIARARAIDLRRRRAAERRIGAPLESAEGAMSEATAAGAAESQERSCLVRRALATLTDDQRVAVEAAFFDGLTHVEVAARLGAPLGTVKSRIRTGLEKLRDELGAHQGDLR